MTGETILYISDQVTNSNSVSAAFNAAGYEVVSTNSATEAMALLYVLHTVAGVVLNLQAGEQTRFDVARSLRAIHPDVPIILLCRYQIDRLPSCVDACVRTSQSLEKLTSEVQSLLTAHSAQY
jgi:CheY-like chemotaxis protein